MHHDFILVVDSRSNEVGDVWVVFEFAPNHHFLKQVPGEEFISSCHFNTA
jgi:hypothetical protein